MLNQTPIWKYILVVFVMALCALYAMPNIYGEDPAVQISSGRNATVTEQLIPGIQSSLDSASIVYKGIEYNDERILVRLNDNDTQLKARELLDSQLGEEYFVL